MQIKSEMLSFGKERKLATEKSSCKHSEAITIDKGLQF